MFRTSSDTASEPITELEKGMLRDEIPSVLDTTIALLEEGIDGRIYLKKHADLDINFLNNRRAIGPNI